MSFEIGTRVRVLDDPLYDSKYIYQVGYVETQAYCAGLVTWHPEGYQYIRMSDGKLITVWVDNLELAPSLPKPVSSTSAWVGPPKSSADKIQMQCDLIKDMLLEKNRKYGDSALEPVRVFSSADPVEQIKVRLDDKLSRVANAQDDEDEDVLDDLIGYLILLKIALDDPAQNVVAANVNQRIFVKDKLSDGKVYGSYNTTD